MKLDFVACETCTSKPHPEWLKGYYYKNPNDPVKTIVECRCHKAWRRKVRLVTEMQRQGITVLDEDLAYEPTELIQQGGQVPVGAFELIIKEYKTKKEVGAFKGKLVYLHGPLSSGKTTLVRWFLREMIKAGCKINYFTLYNFVNKMFPVSYEDGVQSEAKISTARLSGQEVVIIDNFSDEDSAMIKNSQVYQLEPLIKKMVSDDKKLVILVSRSSPEETKKNITESMKTFIKVETGKNKTVLELKSQLKMFDVDDIFSAVRSKHETTP